MTSTGLLVLLVGIIPAVLTALVTWAVAKRSRSGKVATTEAETLWAESQAMRLELRNEVAALRAENLDLRAEVRNLRAEILVLRRQVESE